MDILANVAIRESYYKLRYQWYLTPHSIAKIYPGSNATCWRCKQQKRDIVHMWWACPKIACFWRQIYYAITSSLHIPLKFSAKQCLLHLDLRLIHQVNCETDLVNNLLVAANILNRPKLEVAGNSIVGLAS